MGPTRRDCALQAHVLAELLDGVKGAKPVLEGSQGARAGEGNMARQINADTLRENIWMEGHPPGTQRQGASMPRQINPFQHQGTSSSR